MINLASSKIGEILLKESLIDKILQDALMENPQLSVISQDKLRLVIRNGLEEMVRLEQVAWHHRRSNIAVTPEAARRIKAVLMFSGPGTWYESYKEDRYKDKLWAAWMDHHRLVHGTWVIRRITEINTGICFQGSLNTLDERVRMTRAVILTYGPYFAYTGRGDERDAVRRALMGKRVIIPVEKVHIIEGRIDNTVDQVRTLQIPPGLSMDPGDRVAIVAHSPQLVRLGHMLERYKPFPPGIEVQPFPLPIPKGGISEYPEQEIRGLLYYAFIRDNASTESYPYIVE